MVKKKRGKKGVVKKRKATRKIKSPKTIGEISKKKQKRRRVKRIIHPIKYIRLPREESQVEKTLIENFVSLQKIMVNLSSKLDNLTNQISNLLGLFEASAKVLAEKDFESENSKENNKILEKIDAIIEQNKTIARGLTLIHEKTTPQVQNYSPAPVDYSPAHTNYLSNPPSYSPPKSNYPATQSIDAGIPKLPSTKLSSKPIPRVTMPQGDDGEYHKSIVSARSVNEQ